MKKYLIFATALSALAVAPLSAEEGDADSFSGEWNVAWDHDLSHLSIYETSAVPKVPVPAAALPPDRGSSRSWGPQLPL